MAVTMAALLMTVVLAGSGNKSSSDETGSAVSEVSAAVIAASYALSISLHPGKCSALDLIYPFVGQSVNNMVHFYYIDKIRI